MPPPRPLANRVTPFGDLIADPSRGLLLGSPATRMLSNRRGSRSVGSAAPCCSGGGGAGSAGAGYTELFFCDEVTALAAGDRPSAPNAAARTRAGSRPRPRTRSGSQARSRSTTSRAPSRRAPRREVETPAPGESRNAALGRRDQPGRRRFPPIATRSCQSRDYTWYTEEAI